MLHWDPVPVQNKILWGKQENFMGWIQTLDSLFGSQMKKEWQTSVKEQTRVKLYPLKAQCALSESIKWKSVWPSQRSVPIGSGCWAENWRINRCYLSEEGHKECSRPKDSRKTSSEEKITELCWEEDECLLKLFCTTLTFFGLLSGEIFTLENIEIWFLFTPWCKRTDRGAIQLDSGAYTTRRLT